MTTFKNIYLFIWLHQVIAVACKLLVAVTWDLVPWPRMEPHSVHWEYRILATGPPGKSPNTTFLIFSLWIKSKHFPKWNILLHYYYTIFNGNMVFHWIPDYWALRLPLVFLHYNNTTGTCLVIQWLRFLLLVQGTWVRSLVGELRSHILQANKPEYRQQMQYCNKFNKDFKNCYNEHTRTKYMEWVPPHRSWQWFIW